ncbi:hypothetical protein WJX72_009676 [[Myrmecia] bisecta]|uniref:Expansin-like EG45 domain-containing protein n=1 Tax=[Myrmecia] bisecta TaxID=41462 RepID=A0AAW1PQ47_9CHLO
MQRKRCPKVLDGALVVVATLSLASSQPYVNYFGSQFAGEATYYDTQVGAGHCSFQFSDAPSLQWTQGLTGPRFVGLNRPQYYDDSGACAACGMCIAMYGEQSNLECTTCGDRAYAVPPSVQYLIVSDECPECETGSLDQAAKGDGRWNIHWHPVQCDVQDTTFHYAFQGSNDYYIKLTVTNTRVPAAEMRIRVNGSPTYSSMQKTADNYFVLFSAIPVQLPADVEVTSVFGDIVLDTVAATSPTSPPVIGKSNATAHAEWACESVYQRVLATKVWGKSFLFRTCVR